MIRKASAALVLGLALASSASAEIGRVKSVAGQALVQRGPAKIVPRIGQTLEQGDVLVTGPTGRVGMTFLDNTRFSAGPNSRISLSEFAFNDTTHKGKFLTSVDRGSLAIVSGQIAKENRDQMKVRTPTSLLGVRGTRFVVKVD